jgi:hypothetical protein
MHMNNFWYRGDNGAFSECRDAVYADPDAWRKGYWQTFGESALYKTPEWAHEEEYRIVAHSGFRHERPISESYNTALRIWPGSCLALGPISKIS